MSEARVNNLSNESNTGGPTISGISTFSGTNFFVPPVGNTAQRPDNPQKGAIRFNTDSKHLEYFRGDTIGWSEVEASHGQLGGGSGSNAGVGARGLMVNGGVYGAYVNEIKYITISTLGADQDFGDSTYNSQFASSHGGSRTRAVWTGGYTPVGRTNIINHVTFSSTGNAVDFGDSTQHREGAAGGSNGTRGVFAFGWINPNATNIIDYITIASTGDAKDFGDTSKSDNGATAVSSTTRMVMRAGDENYLDYITIATTGNSSDFGDLSSSNDNSTGSVFNSTRGCFGGGNPGTINNINYITIATFGNSIDFGDLTAAKRSAPGVSSPTRGVFMGGQDPASPNPQLATMDYIEIMTTGNAKDFGDLGTGRTSGAGQSNAHGGL